MSLEQETKVTRSRFIAVWTLLFGWPLFAGFLGWLDFGNWWGVRGDSPGRTPQPTSSSGLGIGTNIPGGQVMDFLVWKQTLEQDCWDMTAGFYDAESRITSKNMAQVIWLSFHSHLWKEKSSKVESILNISEVVTLSVNNWCPWDSEGKSGLIGASCYWIEKNP